MVKSTINTRTKEKDIVCEGNLVYFEHGNGSTKVILVAGPALSEHCFKGTVVYHNNENDVQVGYFSDSWLKEGAKQFNGTVTLET